MSEASLPNTSLESRYASLFQPYTVVTGDVMMRNRLVLAPLTTYSSNPNGTITAEEVEFLRRRSRGVGMAITAACYVSIQGHAFPGQWSCASDEMIPSLRLAAEAIRESGALAVLQLHHGGRLCPASVLGHPPLGPSAIPSPRPGSDMPREMTESEIERTIAAFGQAARRAVRAGFDAVEIHGANGYLLQQFFSPHANQRTDQWGGSVENRAAFPIAIMEEVQEVVRRNAYRSFAIGYRLSPEESTEPGITLEDTLHLVEGLTACRPDWIHISTVNYFAGSIRGNSDPRPRAAVIAERIHGRCAIIGVGSILHPDAAVSVLEDNVDFVALGRGLIMEPEWVDKTLASRESEIRTCLPKTGGDQLLNIPSPMYERFLRGLNHVPLCED